VVVALLGLRLNNPYFSVIIYEAQIDQFLVHQSQTWLDVVPRQVDVRHQEYKNSNSIKHPCKTGCFCSIILRAKRTTKHITFQRPYLCRLDGSRVCILRAKPPFLGCAQNYSDTLSL
jgi:hypothetical protein